MTRPFRFAIPLLVPLVALLSASEPARAQNFPHSSYYPITVQQGYFGHDATPLYSMHRTTTSLTGGLHANRSIAPNYLSTRRSSGRRGGGMGRGGMRRGGGGRSSARSSGGVPAGLGGAGAAALMGGRPAR